MGRTLCDRCIEIDDIYENVHTSHGMEQWCWECCDKYSVFCERCGDTYEEEWGHIDNDGVCQSCRIDRAEPDYDYKHEDRKNRGSN